MRNNGCVSHLSGLPTEFHYPAAQLIDFTGKGIV